jgi:DNA processing protein
MAAAEDQGPKYEAPTPEGVRVTNLAAVLGGLRPIVPEQQSRLGFEADPSGFRLWSVGDVSLIRQRAVAIVGTREVSAEGAARARRLARELVGAGVVVVSGLARGVDTEALTAAIDAGGRVVAVIGTPIDKAYPAENRRLQERIYRDHLLISQFEPGTRTFPSHFPERNKLMAALTDASAIIEAGETSGTLHQATECIRLRRWLFIAKNVMQNPALHWPARFITEPNVRTLIDTDDILSVLPTHV